MVCEDTLKIRNLPNELSNSEKEDFLRHFGAFDVKIITSRVKQKSVVYAKFPSKEVAKNVLHRLHQFNLLNSRLVVEYAEHDIIGQSIGSNINLSKTKTTQDPKKNLQSFIKKLNAFNNSVNFNQPPPPHLKYAYPKPNRATINNIAHALASIPKFYTQVLHLMNKMNLPPPFSNVPDPPQVRQPQFQCQQIANKEESSESEMESDPESSQQINKDVIPEKRKIPQKKGVKRPKFIKPNVVPSNTNKNINKPEDVFETTEMQSRKIEMKVNSENLEQLQAQNENIETEDDQEEQLSEEPKNTVITEEELDSNRIPAKDLGVLPIFKNYHCGAPSPRLYIKNIAKNVEEKDLEYIYKRYLVEENKKEESAFEIKLMREGRMKGQAFITFDSVEIAQKALKETNGFILKDKPLVVVYARALSNSDKK